MRRVRIADRPARRLPRSQRRARRGRSRATARPRPAPWLRLDAAPRRRSRRPSGRRDRAGVAGRSRWACRDRTATVGLTRATASVWPAMTFGSDVAAAEPGGRTITDLLLIVHRAHRAAVAVHRVRAGSRTAAPARARGVYTAYRPAYRPARSPTVDVAARPRSRTRRPARERRVGCAATSQACDVLNVAFTTQWSAPRPACAPPNEPFERCRHSVPPAHARGPPSEPREHGLMPAAARPP